MVSWLVGKRDGDTACTFIDDLASRLAHRVQLSTDGHKPHLEAVEGAFGADIDYAMVIKMYSNAPTGNETRYSPGECCGIKKTRISGNPDLKYTSTSYTERMNLSIRMGMRRFTRLTNAHSKKIENHRHALAIYFMYYNFARIHLSLRCTPAMEAGISNHVWSIGEIIALIG
jgi:hypothetical protein